MSKVLITRSKLDDLATTIAAKSGATLPLTIAQMDAAVDGIVVGSGTDTSHDTVDAAHLLDGYTAHDSTGAAITGSYVPPTFTTQAKTATPTTSQQTVAPDSGYDGLSQVTVNAIPSQYIIPSGNKAITDNGNNIDVAEYATVSVSVSGSSKNVQVAQSTSRATSSTYTSVCSLTCSTAGTYDVYWDCFRSSTGGTSGSQLYIGGNAYGSANTSFTNHAQTNHLTGVSLSKNQTVAVYARSRGSNYYAYCGQLTIVQTA